MVVEDVAVEGGFEVAASGARVDLQGRIDGVGGEPVGVGAIVGGRQRSAVVDLAEVVGPLVRPVERVDGLRLRDPFGDLRRVARNVPDQSVVVLVRVGVVHHEGQRLRARRGGLDGERRRHVLADAGVLFWDRPARLERRRRDDERFLSRDAAVRPRRRLGPVRRSALVDRSGRRFGLAARSALAVSRDGVGDASSPATPSDPPVGESVSRPSLSIHRGRTNSRRGGAPRSRTAVVAWRSWATVRSVVLSAWGSPVELPEINYPP